MTAVLPQREFWIATAARNAGLLPPGDRAFAGLVEEPSRDLPAAAGSRGKKACSSTWHGACGAHAAQARRRAAVVVQDAASYPGFGGGLVAVALIVASRTATDTIHELAPRDSTSSLRTYTPRTHHHQHRVVSSQQHRMPQIYKQP